MYSLTAMIKNKANRTKIVRNKDIRAIVVRTHFLELKTSEEDVRTILVWTKAAWTKLFANELGATTFGQTIIVLTAFGHFTYFLPLITFLLINNDF